MLISNLQLPWCNIVYGNVLIYSLAKKKKAMICLCLEESVQEEGEQEDGEGGGGGGDDITETSGRGYKKE